MVIGITGKYCAGKNRVSGMLEERGYRSIDADRLGHRALSERREAIVARFGPGILGAGGEVDRRRLGEIVFAERRELAALEAIVHPFVVGEIERLVGRSLDHPLRPDRRRSARGSRLSTDEGDAADRWIINAPLLFQAGLHRLCDLVLFVRAPLLVRIARGIRRDHLPLRQILRRIWAQRHLSPQPFRGDVDIEVVKNSGAARRLARRLARLVPVSGSFR